MEPDDLLDLEISDVVYPGKGLARTGGRVVFVRGTLPAERVRARVASVRKTFAEARVEEVLLPSPSRVEPRCPLAARCPGCSYQHASYEEEVRLKGRQLEDLLRKLGGVAAPPCSAPAASPSALGYRNKLVLHADGPGADSALGYFGEDNRTVIDVPDCPLAMPRLREALGRLRADPEFRRSLKAGDAVTLRCTAGDGTVWWIEGRERAAEPWLRENTRLGVLQVHRRDFFQVNPAVADLVVEHVGREIGAIRPLAVIDAYCGVGVFAFAAARAGAPAVLGMDSSGTAIRAARRNAAALGLPLVEFRACRAERWLAEALACVEAGRTAVIVDPPRQGLSAEVVTALERGRCAHLLYVSCAPDTLARDVKRLAAAGFALGQCRVFDMFPRTSHFETVARLDARTPA